MSDWRALFVDDDSGLAAIFRESKTVAVLGAKTDSSEPAYYVPAYLHGRGYQIRPVNPRFAGRRLHDAETVPALRDLAGPADVIEVFRRPEYLPGHADEIPALPAEDRVVSARHPARRRRREAGAGRDPRGPGPLHDARASSAEIAGVAGLVGVRAAGRRGAGV